MRWVFVVLAWMLASSAVAQEHRWATAEANQYWPLKEERIRAYREHDRAAFERILADDFVGMSPAGQHQTRDEYLDAEFAADEGVSFDTEVSGFNAHRTGSTLVLSYEETARGQVGETTFTEHLARTDVYVRQRGRWRLLTMTAVTIPQPPARVDMSAEALAQYAGVYRFAPEIVSTVRLDGVRLVERTTGNEEVELIPIGPDLFYSPPDLIARIEFERDAAGRVVMQVYRSGDQVLRGRRE